MAYLNQFEEFKRKCCEAVNNPVESSTEVEQSDCEVETDMFLERTRLHSSMGHMHNTDFSEMLQNDVYKSTALLGH